MSDTKGTQDNSSSPHRNWYGADENYPSGMTWERSMFPPTERDENVWGPQDPVEIVPSPGPFDKEDGEQSWRVSDGGRDIYTGDVHIRSRAPGAQQQERQTRFWAEYEPRMADRGESGVKSHQEQNFIGVEQFPDVLPTPSGPLPASVYTKNPAQQIATTMNIPKIALQPPPQLPNPSPAPRGYQSPVLDREYEAKDGHLEDAPAAQPILIVTHNNDRAPSSTPPETLSPQGIDDWNDDNLLSFYKFKVIRKKGYEPMLEHFPGKSTSSLHETWRTHRRRCEELGAAWKAAGKPKGSVAEWLDNLKLSKSSDV